MRRLTWWALAVEAAPGRGARLSHQGSQPRPDFPSRAPARRRRGLLPTRARSQYVTINKENDQDFFEERPHGGPLRLPKRRPQWRRCWGRGRLIAGARRAAGFMQRQRHSLEREVLVHAQYDPRALVRNRGEVLTRRAARRLAPLRVRRAVRGDLPLRPGSPTRRGVGALSRPRHRPHRSRRPTLRRAPRLRSRSWMARRRRRAARRAAAVIHPPNTAAPHGADVPWREDLPGRSLQGGARAGRTAAWPRPGWRVSTPCGRRSGAATSRSSAWRMRWRWGCAAGQPRACRRGDQPCWGYIDGSCHRTCLAAGAMAGVGGAEPR